MHSPTPAPSSDCPPSLRSCCTYIQSLSAGKACKGAAHVSPLTSASHQPLRGHLRNMHSSGRCHHGDAVMHSVQEWFLFRICNDVMLRVWQRRMTRCVVVVQRHDREVGRGRTATLQTAARGITTSDHTETNNTTRDIYSA